MGESTKAVCALLMIVGIFASAFAWNADPPDATTWGFRIGGPTVALLAVGLILKLHFRRDLERDYLRSLLGTYFNRGGFCFGFAVTPINGIAFMDAYFQTQYDKPCLGRIALRPAQGFFLTRANIATVTFEIECPPAGFGIARIAIPIPKKLQGKQQTFEVGASVVYPDGKGRRIRFYDGVFLRSNTNFGNSFGTALTIAAATTGAIVLSKPATITVALPTNVAEILSGSIPHEVRTLWQYGEPPLELRA